MTTKPLTADDVTDEMVRELRDAPSTITADRLLFSLALMCGEHAGVHRDARARIAAILNTCTRSNP